jgi:AP2-associated kinase
MQVWFRVNELLPLELQKRLPDGPSSAMSMSLQDEGAHRRTHVMPRRNPPPPPREQIVLYRMEAQGQEMHL